MKGRNLAVIAAALRPGSGTTLLARLFTDYAILSREHPLIFDTDSLDCDLSRYFPHSARLVDLDRVQGQMSLFDTLASAAPGTPVVDVTYRRLKKFFDLMHDIDYLPEARLRHVADYPLYRHAGFRILRAGAKSARPLRLPVRRRRERLDRQTDAEPASLERLCGAEPAPIAHAVGITRSTAGRRDRRPARVAQ